MYKPPKGYVYAVGYEGTITKSLKIVAYFKTNNKLREFCEQKNKRSVSGPVWRAYKWENGEWQRMTFSDF